MNPEGGNYTRKPFDFNAEDFRLRISLNRCIQKVRESFVVSFWTIDRKLNGKKNLENGKVNRFVFCKWNEIDYM